MLTKCVLLSLSQSDQVDFLGQNHIYNSSDQQGIKQRWFQVNIFNIDGTSTNAIWHYEHEEAFYKTTPKQELTTNQYIKYAVLGYTSCSETKILQKLQLNRITSLDTSQQSDGEQALNGHFSTTKLGSVFVPDHQKHHTWMVFAILKLMSITCADEFVVVVALASHSYNSYNTYRHAGRFLGHNKVRVKNGFIPELFYAPSSPIMR